MKVCMSKFWNRLERGQALVEMAIITPVLIFLLVGVFEVGWALRNYMILANTSREAARFASRPDYLDLTAYDLGFNKVYTHALASASNQLYTDQLTLILSVISIDSQWVCDYNNLSACDCATAVTNPYSPTIIIHPGMISYTHWMTTFPATSTLTTRLDFEQLTTDLAASNRRLNCELTVKSGGTAILRKNELVTAEIYYTHFQLFGFPIWSNPYTDPFTMYGHTTMRILDARKSEAENNELSIPTVSP